MSRPRRRRTRAVMRSGPRNVAGTEVAMPRSIAVADRRRRASCSPRATEPDAGSDLAALKTVAKPHNGGYRISGAEQWISNGGVADLSTVLAIAPGGPSWFVVERDREGFTHGNDGRGVRARRRLGRATASRASTRGPRRSWR
jgi:alkylation response protein AidB-like acyl-CoA dehydrogenase